MARTRTGTLAALAGLVGITMAGASTPASAQTMERITGPQLQSLMQDWGYRAELTTDNEGDPKIRSSTQGTGFSIYFYDCTKTGTRDCRSVQFSAGMDLTNGLTLTKVNDWHREMRFGRVWLDDDHDPYIEMVVKFDDGITEGNLRSWFLTWDTTFGDFLKHIDW